MFSSARKRALIAKNIEKGLLNEIKASGIRLREKPISTNQPKIQCTRERSFTKLLLKKFPSSEQQYLGRRWLWPSKGAKSMILRSESSYCTQSVFAVRLCKLGTSFHHVELRRGVNPASITKKSIPNHWILCSLIHSFIS